MDVREDVRAGVVQDFVAAFEALEVFLERQVPALQHGAHGAVGNDDAVVHGVQKLLRAGRAGNGLNIKHKTRHLNRLRVGAGTLRCVSVCYGGVERQRWHALRPTADDDD
ncbi:hypothetical protein GCM10011577_37670 [Pseudarthrobacter polychromogenes]|uniref:Uncharacterized protein n=1 Tax=Pseudarthrobacter polychromogenes TaxID=1676 RepID=A0ABQ1Y147_9MICC|nr:hypothetical protein GCM10011577_37670 [Pseudarthrobacter polychromogenes]